MRLQLHIPHREPDRIVVTVQVHPDGEPLELDGVCVQMLGPSGTALGPRVVLPLRGALHGMVCSTVALLTEAAVPRGARVVARAWTAAGDVECCAHVDRITDLESHMRGFRRCRAHASDAVLEPLSEREHEALARCFAWVGAPVRTTSDLEDEDPTTDPGDLAASYGLDEGDAELLRELLSE